MTMEMDGPGMSGFGYGSQGSEPRTDSDHKVRPQFEPATETQPTPSGDGQGGNGAAQSQATNGGAAAVAQTENQAEVVDLVPLDFDFAEPVPGYETSASDCLNHALSIARNLKHGVLSTDHLMLALVVDQGARRLLERVGDIGSLRHAAMRRLASLNSKYSSSDPSQTVDLEDLRALARARAAEREQRVAISDLVDALPKENGRLIYGQDPKEALLNNLVPRVSDAVARIEAAVREATQGQRVTVEQFMRDLNARLFGNEQGQRELMEDMRRQVREAVDSQSALLRDLDAKVSAAQAELTSLRQANEAVKQEPVYPPTTPGPRKYWSWIVL